MTMVWVKKIFARGYQTISLSVPAQNVRAQAFYEKNGCKIKLNNQKKPSRRYTTRAVCIS